MNISDKKFSTIPRDRNLIALMYIIGYVKFMQTCYPKVRYYFRAQVSGFYNRILNFFRGQTLSRYSVATKKKKKEKI